MAVGGPATMDGPRRRHAVPTTPLAAAAAPIAATFPGLLRSWRRRRRLSQLELALESGVSQRHLSFLESGRCGAQPRHDPGAQPRRSTVPLRDRNAWLLAAGFAPVFRSRPLDDPQMTQVMSAVRMMLANHEPFPAIAIDRAWNIRLSNGPFDRAGVDARPGPLDARRRRAAQPHAPVLPPGRDPAPGGELGGDRAPALAPGAARGRGGRRARRCRSLLETGAAPATPSPSGSRRTRRCCPSCRSSWRRTGCAFALHGHRDLRHAAGRDGRRAAHREPVPCRRGDGAPLPAEPSPFRRPARRSYPRASGGSPPRSRRPPRRR